MIIHVVVVVDVGVSHVQTKMLWKWDFNRCGSYSTCIGGDMILLGIGLAFSRPFILGCKLF